MNPHAIMSHRETGREELFNPIDQKCVTFEEPYKRLLASIMLQSFDDLTLKLDISDSTMCGQVKRIERNRLEYRKAADWFMSKSDHFTSF